MCVTFYRTHLSCLVEEWWWFKVFQGKGKRRVRQRGSAEEGASLAAWPSYPTPFYFTSGKKFLFSTLDLVDH